MSTQISKKTARELKEVSKLLNLEEGVIVERAIKYFVSSVIEELELKREIALWNQASDEDWFRFEKKYLS